MPPVGTVKPSGAPPPPSRSPSEERADHLTDGNLVGDDRWQSSAFRQRHMKLFFALDAVQKFMAGKIDEAKLETKINAWLQHPEFSSQANKGFYDSVLKNIHRTLGLFQNPDNVALAKTVGNLVPGKPKPPAPSKPAPKPTANPFDKSEYTFNAINLDFRIGDEALRSVPHYLTLKVLPEVGMGQNLSSKRSLNLNAEFSFGNFHNSVGVYHEDVTPRGGATTYQRTGVQFILNERGGQIFGGKRGPGGGWYVSFNGRSRIGMEFGVVLPKSIAGSEISGSEASFISPQIGLISDTQLFSVGYGPWEGGLMFLPSKTFLHSGSLRLSNTNKSPFTWTTTYHLREPEGPGNPKTPEEIVKNYVTNPELLTTGLKIGNTGVRGYLGRFEEGSFQLSRLLGSPSIFDQTKTGSFVLGFNMGRGGGSLAFEVGRRLRLADPDKKFALGLLNQRTALLVPMGAEFLINVIGALKTPGPSDSIRTFQGEAPPPDFDPSTNEGFSNLKGHAFSLGVPQVAMKHGLALLGWMEPFGSRNDAIKNKTGVFNSYTLPHMGLMALGGVLVLTSGDFTGGTLGWSILGNRAPVAGEVIEIKNSRLSLENQRFQHNRVFLGGLAVGYAGAALLDFYYNRYKYLDLKDKQGKDGNGLKGTKTSSSLVRNPRLGFQLNDQGVNFMLSGSF